MRSIIKRQQFHNADGQALSTQDEPIYGELTTEGFTRDGYLDERLKEARKVLKVSWIARAG